MNALRYIRMVLWSFLGIRRRSGAEEEIARLRPIPLLLTAVLLAVAFCGALIWLATLAVGALE